jgi:aspartyl aminopeptidase
MCYGAGLWRTWLDRDLTLAGKVIVKEGDKLVGKYWNAKRPLVNLPSLCIHLDPEKKAFTINKEDHLKPVIATAMID